MGPYSEKDLKKLSEKSSNFLVWNESLNGWTPFMEILKKTNSKWSFSSQGNIELDLSYKELLLKIKTTTQKNEILLQSPDSEAKWSKLYDHPEILKDLNLELRKDPRYETAGTINLSSADHDKTGQIYKISLSGFSATNLFEVQVQKNYQCIINLKNEVESFHLDVTCVHSQNNNVGFLITEKNNLESLKRWQSYLQRHFGLETADSTKKAA